MATFDFDVARAERLRQREPITFTLGGETFTCLPFQPLAVVWGLVDAPDTAELAKLHPAEAVKVCAELVADLLVPGDVDRWWGVFRSKEHPVDGQAVVEVMETLVMVYTGRPTVPSVDSSAGRQTTGNGSKSRRSKKASARSAS